MQAWRRTLLESAAIALVAVIFRGLYLYQLHGTLPFSTLIIDGRAYDAWGQRIAAGDWLGSEVFYQAPFYPYLLGGLYGAFGHDPMLVRVAQAALSVSSCLLLAWAGRRLFDSRAGLIAGLLLAIYPPAIFFDGLVQKAALDLWLMTLLLALVAEAQFRRSWPWLLAAGTALGALTLNRENARVLYPLLAVWVWLYFRDVSAIRRVKWIGAMSAGVALALVPVGIRNYYVGGEFLLTTSQVGPNFYIGNHAGATGRYEPLVPRRGDPRFERADATRLAEQATGRELSPAEVSRYWLDRSFDYMRSKPGDWFKLLGWKSLLVLHATEVVDSESIDVYAEYSGLLRGLLRIWHFGVLMPLAALGIWLTRRNWRELAVLYGMFALLAASTALFYVFARYRFTLVPIALLFAAAALSNLPHFVAAVRQRRWLREWGPGLLLAVIAAVVCNYPLPDTRDDAVTYMNLGLGLIDDGKPAAALEPLDQAIEAKPDLAGAYHNKGLALSALKRADEAAQQFELAIRYAPDYGDAHASLGQYYADKGQPNKAIPHFRQAIANVAEPTLLHVELGQLLVGQGDSAGAVEQFRAALELDPDLPIALNNLAWVLSTDPDPRIRNGAEAVALAERLTRGGTGSNSRTVSPAAEAGQLDTLAAAYAETGRFDDALATIRSALGLARSAGEEQLAKILESRVAFYEVRQPFRSQMAPPPKGNGS